MRSVLRLTSTVMLLLGLLGALTVVAEPAVRRVVDQGEPATSMEAVAGSADRHAVLARPLPSPQGPFAVGAGGDPLGSRDLTLAFGAAAVAAALAGLGLFALRTKLFGRRPSPRRWASLRAPPLHQV